MRSESGVNPRTSQKSTVTSRRSPVSAMFSGFLRISSTTSRAT